MKPSAVDVVLPNVGVNAVPTTDVAVTFAVPLVYPVLVVVIVAVELVPGATVVTVTKPDLPPLNSTTFRERIWWCENQRRTFNATRKERTGRADHPQATGGRSGGGERQDRHSWGQVSWTWDLYVDQWNEGFEQLKQYVKQNGSARVPQDFKTKDGFRLGGWISHQRNNKDSLSAENRNLLKSSCKDWTWGVIK